ncbi:MAG: outer membrane protein assembly factor BamA [Deltaproteobacteria bacterium]|nr:outer membrane protein assembly factor BamA [Deltaproteobacteria bacterium]
MLALCLLLASLPAGVAADEGSLFGRGALSRPDPDKKDEEAAPADDTEPLPDETPVLQLVIAKLSLAGLERVESKVALGQIRSREGMAVDPQLVADDVRRLFQLGLFDDVRVGLKRLPQKPDATETPVELRFQLLERPSISAIEVRGNTEQSTESINKVIDLRINNLYSPQDAATNVTKIKDLYRDEGFFLATVSHHVEPQPQNQVKVVFDVVERAEVKVREVQLLGNEGIADDDIKAVLRTQEGGVTSIIGKGGNFKPDNLDMDVQILQYLYLTRGYIQAKIDEPIVSLSPDMKYITIAVRIHEGPQFRVGKVSVEGDTVEPADKVVPTLALKPGDIFNYAMVQQDGNKIRDLQKNAGYAHATVENNSVPDMDKRTVDWTYRVQRGKKCFFGQISLAGGTSTRDKVIRREMTFVEGELYSEQKIQQSQARIQRLGYFEKVEIKTKPTAIAQVLDVVVEVKERTTGTFQVGMGFSSIDNFIATMQIAKDNFLGRGQRMSVQGQLSSIRTVFQASFFEPYFLDSNVTFSIDLYRFDQLYTDFSRRATGGGFSWGYRFTDTLIADLGYTGEQVVTTIGGLSGRTTVPVANYFGSGFTSSLRGTLSFDSRDDRMFPTTGWYVSGTAEWANQYIGSDNLFTRFTARIRRFFPLPLDGVLRFNLVGGIIEAPKGKVVPLFERFFVGGIFNVRGYARNSLGPQIAVPSSGDPAASLSAFTIGGTRQLYLNNEVEVPIIKAPMNLRGLMFFDIGNAFGEGQSVLDQGSFPFRMSVGWGIRWFSPVGPLRFEWGVPINPRPGEQPLAFEFTIGNSF